MSWKKQNRQKQAMTAINENTLLQTELQRKAVTVLSEEALEKIFAYSQEK